MAAGWRAALSLCLGVAMMMAMPAQTPVAPTPVTPTGKPAAAKPKAKPKAQAKPKTQANPKAQAKPNEKGKGQSDAKPAAKTPALPPRQRIEVSQFTSPDGSRFVLVRDPSVAHIHWAITSWADGTDDPKGLPGLTLATAQASLSGTWSSSTNAQAEREALTALSTAWQQQLGNPGDRKIALEILRLDNVAAELGDRRSFQRVLAGAPSYQAQVHDRDPFATLVLTTIEPALETVAKLMLERREEQALRGMARAWMPNVLARIQAHAAHPRRRLHAEALALLMPFSPAIARLEAPPVLAPSRAQAIATWESSQHPTRTVHVLFGTFDEAQTKATLAKVFAETKLPLPTPRRDQMPRPLASQRRSVVPGLQGGGGVIAWVLPPNTDPWSMALIQHWLASPLGQLRRQMSKQRPNLVVECYAPWPASTNGQSLLMLDVSDPAGPPGVIEDVLATCKTITAKPFSSGLLYQSYLELLHDWTEQADNPRTVAMLLAERALMWPSADCQKMAPESRKGEAIYPILKAVFRSQPAIVEAKQ